MNKLDHNLVLRDISAAFAMQDKDLVKARVCDAFYLKIDKEETLQALSKGRLAADEEFGHWAY